MSDETGRTPATGMQSVDRALQALDLLAEWGEGAVGEIATALGVHKSTASRLLSTLEARELVEVTEDRGKYRLGFGIIRLASSASGQLQIAHQAHRVTEPLAHDVGETVNFAILSETYAVNIDQAMGPSAVGVHNWVGKLTPLHATSSGKVILAHLPREEWETVLPEGRLVRLTPHTITSRAVLEAQVDATYAQGYAVTYGELDEEINAIAVPVHDLGGTFVGALSISGPAFRFDEPTIMQHLARLQEAGKELGRRVGHLG